jgi:hypothetical protein
MRILVAAVAVSLISSMALAAEPPTRPTELKQLDRLVGNWKMAEFVSKKAVWTPEEIQTSGDVATTKWIMDGWFLEDRKTPAGGAEHLGLWHFDQAEKAYHYTMFLAPGGGRLDITIHWDEKDQAFKGVGSLPNGVTLRTVTRFPDKNTKEWTAVATDAAGVVYQDMKAKEVRTDAK